MDILGAKVNDLRRGCIGTVQEVTPPEMPQKLRVIFTDGRDVSFRYPADFEEKVHFVDDGLQHEAELVLAGQRTDGGIPEPRGKAVIKGGGSFVSYGPGGQVIHRTSLTEPGVRPAEDIIVNVDELPDKMLELIVDDTQGHEQQIVIVKDAMQQNSKQGIYWAERDIAKTIRNAIYNNRRDYDYRGVHYEIITLKTFEGMDEAAEKWAQLNRADERPVKVFRKKGIYDNPAWGYAPVNVNLRFPKYNRVQTVQGFTQGGGDAIYLPRELFADLYKKNGMPENDLRFIEPETAEERLWNLQRDTETKRQEVELAESRLRITGELHVIQRRKLKEQIDALKAELPELEAELEQAGGPDAPCFGRGENDNG